MGAVTWRLLVHLTIMIFICHQLSRDTCLQWDMGSERAKIYAKIWGGKGQNIAVYMVREMAKIYEKIWGDKGQK